MENTSLLDRLSRQLGRAYAENRTPFLASLLTGLAAHMFMLSNKLPNHDDIESLFGKGATITSGRWGLELVKVLFPDWSMPWIYGLLSILLISVAVCAAVRLLELKSGPVQAIVGALVLSFPSLTGTFCFMFTSSSYALAFLLAVLAAYELGRERLAADAAALLLLVLSLSVYQAYIAVTAGLMVLCVIRRTLDGDESLRRTVLFGLRALAVMLLALGVYLGITQLVLMGSGAAYNDYVTGNLNSVSLPTRVKMAYESFRDVFVFRNFYLISSELSRYLHLALLPLLLVMLAVSVKPEADRKERLLRTAAAALLAVVLLPLAINCMYLVMAGDSIHTLVLYSFVCLYLLAALLMERVRGRLRAPLRDLSALILCAAVLSNVYFANMVYLKLDLQLENARAFYTTLAARIQASADFTEGCRLAVVGRQDNLLHSAAELDTELLMGPPRDLINIYSRENFLRQYLGFDLHFATEAELLALEQDPRLEAMAEYPYAGSVARIGELIVVKLG